MDCSAQVIDYNTTGYFSKMVADYVSADNALKPFYNHPASPDGINAAIEERKNFNTDRQLLIKVLTQQYKDISLSAKQQSNLQLLGNNNTFTITTAHQPNILTGPLYFIYKILHAVKLAETLKAQSPENNFVPVYYMGSEDADLDELGHIYIHAEKYEWETKQTGAVGRMIIDAGFTKLIRAIEGQLLVFPHGKEIVELVKNTYKEGTTVEQATFAFVNHLFAEYGLLVVLPDNPELKRSFTPVIEKELKEMFSEKDVKETAEAFPAEYKQQASGRELNLFYLIDNKRERIEIKDDKYEVKSLGLSFDLQQILTELNEHPERFSPNVILRPVFQETILPNIAFIGGGGEIAYWLELKKVFKSVNVPYPVLVLRNSFMVIRKDIEEILNKLQLCHNTIFKPEQQLLNDLVKRDSTLQLTLENEKQAITQLYQQLRSVSGKVDVSLQAHVEVLQTQALKKIEALEKKILRAERKKFDAQQRQLAKAKKCLFPLGNLQERIDNIMPYYAKWGASFIKDIYDHSLALEQKFTILEAIS